MIHGIGSGDRVIGGDERTATGPPRAPHDPAAPTFLDRVRSHSLAQRGIRFGHAVRDRLHEPLRRHPVVGPAYRVVLAVTGVLVVGLGLVLVPAPGPGWLIVMVGLGILATEFAWARRLLHFTRTAVGAWTRWVLRQSLVVRMAFGSAGLLLLTVSVLATLRVSGWTGFPFD